MLFSRMFIPTMKEEPKEAEVMSHKLMLRAGFIRRLSSGIYTWLPLGLKSLRKVERIIREEMDRTGAQEILMPRSSLRSCGSKADDGTCTARSFSASRIGTRESSAWPPRTKR